MALVQVRRGLDKLAHDNSRTRVRSAGAIIATITGCIGVATYVVLIDVAFGRADPLLPLTHRLDVDSPEHNHASATE